MKKNILLLALCCSLSTIYAQNNACNKLGAWMWYIEATTCKTHAELADSLKKLNVKRIYLKVADGKNFANWPELTDKTVVKAYKDKGLEVWGWTYNYPANEALQAEAIYLAAKTGYEGLIVDVEAEFDGDSLGLHKLFKAFDTRKQDAIKDGFANKNFELRVTTWGNPKDHKFNIKAMEPFVSAYMPQTYVEQWGSTYIKNLEKWIDAGNAEYKALGAKKPIYHVVAAEKLTGATGAITAADVNKYIKKAGAETSIWRVPGGDVSAQNWSLWRGINWKQDFCNVTESEEVATFEQVIFSPNPFTDVLNISVEDADNQMIELFFTNVQGQILKHETLENKNQITLNTTDLASGIYFCTLKTASKTKCFKVVK